MANQYLLGIDVGTSSTKVALLSIDGSLIAMERHENSILSPQEGWSELSVNELWDNFLLILKKLLVKANINPGSIKAIGISCLCPGLTAFDKNGGVLINPIIFLDKRSVKEANLIKQRISEEELAKISCNKLMPGACSLTSMMWIKQNMPDTYDKTKYFGHINTFFVQKLTGEIGIDYTNASYTGLFETSRGLKWSEAAAKTAGIDMEKLPPLIPSYSAAGCLISEEVSELGLLKGIPVAMGGADTACSALAAGVIEHNQVFESVGTTNVITVCSDKPVFDIRFMNRCHVVKDRWLYHGAMSSTGASLKWFRDEFCNDLIAQEKETGINAYENMDSLVGSSAPGAGGLIFLPYMAGERTPVWDPNAKGVFFGLNLQSKKGDMIRSILEGCGFGLKQILQIAEGITGESIEEFIAIGGGAKSRVWGQIKSDITGKVIGILDLNDAAVIGAMLLAGLAAGIYSSPAQAQSLVSKKIYMTIYPQQQNKEIYECSFKKYSSLYSSLKDLFHM